MGNGLWSGKALLTGGGVCELESVQVCLQQDVVCTQLCEDADEAPGELGCAFDELIGWHGTVDSRHSVESRPFAEAPDVLNFGCLLELLKMRAAADWQASCEDSKSRVDVGLWVFRCFLGLCIHCLVPLNSCVPWRPPNLEFDTRKRRLDLPSELVDSTEDVVSGRLGSCVVAFNGCVAVNAN